MTIVALVLATVCLLTVKAEEEKVSTHFSSKTKCSFVFSNNRYRFLRLPTEMYKEAVEYF